MFKKRESVDILDLPELHRKKLIKLPDHPLHEETKVTSDGYFILSQEKQETPAQAQTEVKPETPSQVSSFLSDFAGIGSTNPQITPNINKEENSDVKDLKWKLENLEFKLEQLIEKVNSMNLPSAS